MGRGRLNGVALRECLIEVVKAYPAIWNKSHKDHSKFSRLQAMWRGILGELVEEFGESELLRHDMGDVKQIKSIWQNLCRSYRRVRLQNVGGDNSPGWPYFHQMAFLDAFFCPETSLTAVYKFETDEDGLDQTDEANNGDDSSCLPSLDELLASNQGSSTLKGEHDDPLEVPGDGPDRSWRAQRRKVGENVVDDDEGEVVKRPRTDFDVALPKVGQDEDGLFCGYIAQQLRKLPAQEKAKLHSNIFELVHAELSRLNRDGNRQPATDVDGKLRVDTMSVRSDSSPPA